MADSSYERYDFFVSRRGSVKDVAQEVSDVLIDSGYTVIVQDYDIPLTDNFVLKMHEAIKSSRDLIVLLTRDYENSKWTRKEFSSFEADAGQTSETRRIVILRCEDMTVRGLFAPNVYQDLVGVTDPVERKRRIISAARGESLAQKPPPRPFVEVPPRIATFTGRAHELDSLDDILVGERKAAVTPPTDGIGRAALHGMGGVGKTSLAIEYAHRFRDLYAGVWWCPAETRTGLLTSLAELGKELDAVTRTESNLQNAAKAGLRRLSEQRATYLLVYDNVTSPEEISDLLPAAGAHVLITSRFSDWGGWAKEVTVGTLPLAESVALLQSRAGRHDEVGARTLADALGCLPLALDHAGAFCKRTQTGFADYAKQAASLIGTAPRGAAYPRSIAATFQLAIDEAVKTCPAAEAVMAYAALCAPERVPTNLMEGALDDQVSREAALLALTEMSLVTRNPFEDGSAALTVHRLVQAVAKHRSQQAGTKSEATRRLFGRLMALYPRDGGYSDPVARRVSARLTPHVLALREEYIDDTANPQWADLVDRVGQYYSGQAENAAAERLFRSQLSVFEKACGADHPGTAMSLNSLGLVLRQQGDLTGAQRLHERALEIREKMLGPQNPATGQSLQNVALVRMERGDLAGARPLFERALAVAEQALGPDDPGTASVLNNLAGVLREQGDLERSRSLYERVYAIRERSLGANHPATASSLQNVADIFQAQGDTAAARQRSECALEITERALGPEHPLTAIRLSHLAGLLMEQRDLNAARPLYERALAIDEKTLGPKHPTTATVLNNLARLLHEQRDLASARSLLERSLAIHEETLGTDNFETATVLNNLGGVLMDQRDFAGARSLFERSLDIRKKILGPNHPHTRSTVDNLFLLYVRMEESLGAGDPAVRALRERLPTFAK
jgi:tetratricopeptide (TPR) repeat protein